MTRRPVAARQSSPAARGRSTRAVATPAPPAGAGGALGRRERGGLVAEFALRTVAGLNAREHFRVRAERVARERLLTLAALRSQVGMRPPPLPPLGCGTKLLVRLTRVSPGHCDDDNATGALKSVRDAVADYLGVDDADARVAWRCAQDHGPALAVRVELVGHVVACDRCDGGWTAAGGR